MSYIRIIDMNITEEKVNYGAIVDMEETCISIAKWKKKQPAKFM